MRIAAAATGHDRLKWVRVALAWQDLGRREGDDGRASVPLRTARDAGRIGPLSGRTTGEYNGRDVGRLS